MRIQNNTIRTLITQTQSTSKVEKVLQEYTRVINICPFTITLGYINATTSGYNSPWNVNPDNFSSFGRIFSGRESIIAVWDNSTTYSKANSTDTFFTKNYAVGDVIECFIQDEYLASEIVPFNIDGANYQKQAIIKTYTLISKKQFKDIDLFKLYIIPELDSFQWLFIKSCEIVRDMDKQFRFTKIILGSLNDALQKSGQSINQFVQNGSIGEGYAWPAYVDGQIILDPIKLNNYPITSLQVEFSSPIALSTLYAMGRPISNQDNKIQAPRHLFPLKFNTPRPIPISKQQSPENNYYASFGVNPTINTYYNDWKQQVQASYDNLTKKEYEGNLVFKDTKTTNTNPKEAGTGKFQYLAWDNSNVITDTDNTQYQTEVNPYCITPIVYNSLSPTQFLTHNIFTMSSIMSLPFDLTQSTKWNLRELPLIGGFLNSLALGAPLGWVNQTKWIANQGVNVLISAPLYDFATKSIYSVNQDKGILPLDLFKSTEDNSPNGLLSAYSNSYIFNIELTDTYSNLTETNNSVDLGQETTPNNKKYWNSNCKPIPKLANTPGYILDTLIFQGIGKGDYKVTYFSNNQVIGTSIHQTLSTFTGNLRDWTNTIKLSAFERTADNTIIDYPKPVIDKEPTPIPTGLTNINYPVKASDWKIGTPTLQTSNNWANWVITNKSRNYAGNGNYSLNKIQINIPSISNNILPYYSRIQLNTTIRNTLVNAINWTQSTTDSTNISFQMNISDIINSSSYVTSQIKEHIFVSSPLSKTRNDLKMVAEIIGSDLIISLSPYVPSTNLITALLTFFKPTDQYITKDWINGLNGLTKTFEGASCINVLINSIDFIV